MKGFFNRLLKINLTQQRRYHSRAIFCRRVRPGEKGYQERRARTDGKGVLSAKGMGRAWSAAGPLIAVNIYLTQNSQWKMIKTFRVLNVFKNKASTPTYVWLHDGVAEFKDAQALWGKDTWEATDWIRNEHASPNIQSLVTLPIYQLWLWH